MQAASGSRIVKVSDHQHHRIGSGSAIHFFNDDEWKCSYGTVPTIEVNKDHDEIDSDVFIDLEQGECDAKGTRQQEKRTGPLGKRPSDVRGKQGLRGGSNETGYLNPSWLVPITIFCFCVAAGLVFCLVLLIRSVRDNFKNKNKLCHADQHHQPQAPLTLLQLDEDPKGGDVLDPHLSA
jgi:hypothetical protein